MTRPTQKFACFLTYQREMAAGYVDYDSSRETLCIPSALTVGVDRAVRLPNFRQSIGWCLAGCFVHLFDNIWWSSMGVIFLSLFWFSAGLLAYTDVTSQEQFNRVAPGGLPDNLYYNADRVSLELSADDETCPASAHGFFELNINSQGEVTRARDVSVSRTQNLKVMAVKRVKNLLMQIHFRPLRLGSQITSVHTYATVVCR